MEVYHRHTAQLSRPGVFKQRMLEVAQRVGPRPLLGSWHAAQARYDDMADCHAAAGARRLSHLRTPFHVWDHAVKLPMIFT